MVVKLISFLFESPPSDYSISRSFSCRYTICWNCIAAMNESQFFQILQLGFYLQYKLGIDHTIQENFRVFH